jgi:hypothetical protein
MKRQEAPPRHKRSGIARCVECDCRPEQNPKSVIVGRHLVGNRRGAIS